nr:MAG TPA: Minor capsid protein [Caudoviricetes sp.]
MKCLSLTMLLIVTKVEWICHDTFSGDYTICNYRQRKRLRMWNNEITLTSRKIKGKDKLKQPIYEDVEVTILCRKKKVTRSEFYQANQAGLRPSLVVEVHNFEYDNQEHAIFEGKKYRVLKTYPIDSEILELTLSEKLE